MKNLLVLSPIGEEHKRMLQQKAGAFYHMTFTSQADPDWREKLAEAHVVIGEPPMDTLKEAKKLEWIQMTWAGTDIYTRNPGFPEDVKLTNMSGAFGTIISEYVLGAILAMYRNFPRYYEHQRKHLWKDGGSERTLVDKRVLILGAGDIGTAVARRLRPFGTTNVGVRRVIRPYGEAFDQMVTLDQLEQELPLADIVVGCLPNTPATIGLMDEKRLRTMKADGLLVNVGRGSLVVLDDLARVLADGHLSGAVLDVTAPEPLPEDSPLWDMEQVMITPHISGPSFGHEARTEQTIYEICADNLCRYAAGEPLRNLVDFASGYRVSQDG